MFTYMAATTGTTSAINLGSFVVTNSGMMRVKIDLPYYMIME